MFYWAREFSSALSAGQGYSMLPRTIIISIVDFKMFNDSEDFHSFFQPLETKRHTLLSDKMGLHFFELPKLPELSDNASENDMLHLWLSLFKAETVEELEKIKEMEVPVMNEAIKAYTAITSSQEFQEAERLREKARHDEAQALYNAKTEGRIEGKAEGRIEGKAEGKTELIRNLVNAGMPFDQIVKYSGLGKDEIDHLRTNIYLQ